MSNKPPLEAALDLADRVNPIIGFHARPLKVLANEVRYLRNKLSAATPTIIQATLPQFTMHKFARKHELSHVIEVLKQLRRLHGVVGDFDARSTVDNLLAWAMNRLDANVQAEFQAHPELFRDKED
jgi:hypothetical protein